MELCVVIFQGGGGPLSHLLAHPLDPRMTCILCLVYCILYSIFVLSSLFCLFDLILYVPSTIFQVNRDGFSWVEPVLGLMCLAQGPQRCDAGEA